jgi:hypothetical protein
MRVEIEKTFDKPWFYTNWIAFSVALIIPVVYKVRHPQGPAPTGDFLLFGLVLASIALHAVYAGYFAVREAVYKREERPGAYWLSVAAFCLLSLIAFRMGT